MKRFFTINLEEVEKRIAVCAVRKAPQSFGRYSINFHNLEIKNIASLELMKKIKRSNEVQIF